MRGQIPFATLQVDANATVQALSTTPAQFAGFALSTGSEGPSTGDSDGDVSVQADKANNRFKVLSPGIYKMTAVFSGIISAAADLILALRKNGATTLSTTKTRWTNAVQNQIVLTAVFKITPTDNPGTLATMTDPTAPTSPAVSFVGNTGAPKLLVPIDLTVAVASGTPNLTFADGRVTLERIG